MFTKRLRIYLFGLNDSERQEHRAAQAAILPTPDGRPVPTPADPEAHALPTVKNWCHPFRDKNHSLHQLTHLAKAAAGFYPLGVNGLWHGGVHFDGGTAGTVDQSSVHCLADGQVVAYRIDQHSPSTGYIAHKSPVLRPFSRNFVLVRHRLQPPTIDGSPDVPPSLAVYSLYMHLQDWAVYQQDPQVARPGFWPEGVTRQVKATVNDVDLDNLNERGLNIRNQASKGKIIGFLPKGAEVTVSGKGAYRRLENTLGPDKLKNPDGSLKGYVAFSHLLPINTGEYRVVTQNGPLTVRADAHRQAESISVLQQGTEVKVSGEGDYRKLEQINQYVHFDSLQGVLEPLAYDRVVVLDQPVPIKAGDLIGQIGLYQDSHDDPEKRLHLEVFSGDNVKAFIEASRAWALRLPATSKTWLKLVKGTAVVAHQEGFSDKQPPTLKADYTPSDAHLLLPKSLLDGLPAARKIKVSASSGRKACNWYRIEGLLHDAEQTLLDGWVCEQVGVTPWVSPWAWENHDVIYNDDAPRHLLTSYLRATGQFNEAQLERWGPVADMADTGPLKSRLYDIIDRNRDGTITAKEIQTAISLPAHAQSIAQLIIFAESEWCYTRHKWDSLDEPSGHTSSTPHLNWFSEKDRIREISWWGDVAEKLGLRADGKVYHFHPVGLVGSFQRCSFVFTLEIMKLLYPRVDTNRYLDLQAIADELSAHIDFYKLDTPLRRAHFFAQILEDTGPMLKTEENFTYRASALTNLFGYFRSRPAEARKYGFVNKQGLMKEDGLSMGQADFEAIANGAYGGRSELGNRGHSTGDGWKYRGRGLKQLTGRYNYMVFNRWHIEHQSIWGNEKLDFLESPDILLDMKYAARSAASFWLSNKLYDIADKGHSPNIVDLITDVINRSTGSRSGRQANFERLWRNKILL
jgi:predicted chitinase